MTIRDVYGARAARITASQVALAMAFLGCFSAVVFRAHELATPALLLAVVLAVPVYIFKREAARAEFLELTIKHQTLFEARAPADALERRSVAWPFAAIALLGPLVVHWIVASLVALAAKREVVNAEEFAGWMGMSLVIVGHAHVAVLVMLLRKANRMSSLRTAALHAEQDGGFASVWTAGFLASAIPGALFFFIPPMITALTGGALIPVLSRVRWWMLRERVALDQETELDPARPEVRALLDRCLRSSSPALVELAARAAVEIGHHPDADTALAALPFANGASESPIAELIARHKDDRVEAVLLAALGHEERAVKLAAVRALGRVGTVRAVEPLRELAKTGTFKTALRTEAQLSIDHIWDRLDRRAGRGQLALAANDSTEGALSLDTSAGALSRIYATPRDDRR